jgi:hypothetical protein
MNFKPGKFFIGAAAAFSLGTFTVPFTSIANASTIKQPLLQDKAWVQPVQLTQADTSVEKKIEEKTTTTDSAGLPQEDKHVEHETTENTSDSTGAEEKTRHKAEVNESTNALGDTTRQTRETTESSQHN